MQQNPELHCVICFDLFHQPVTLVCGHSFCKECISRSLHQVPKCLLCKYPVFGIFDFRVNRALQRMIDRHKGKTHCHDSETAELEEDQRMLQTLKSSTAVDFNDHINLIRLPAFEVSNDKKYFFKNTLYRLDIRFQLPHKIIAALMPGKCFVGYVGGCTNPRPRANIFELINIVKLKNQGMDVIVRCKDLITIDEIQRLDLTENKDFIEQHDLSSSGKLLAQFVSGERVILSPYNLSFEDMQKVRTVNYKLEHFLSVLRFKNHQVFELLKLRLNFAFTDTAAIIYSYENNLFDYLNFCAALLNLSDKDKKAVYEAKDYRDIINVINDYLDSTTLEDDPLFVFSHIEPLKVNKQWLAVVFFVIVALVIKSVLPRSFN